MLAPPLCSISARVRKKNFRASRLVPAPPLCSSSVRMRKKNFPRFAPRACVLVALAICQNAEKFFRASRLVLASSLCMSSVRMRLFFVFSRFAPRVRFRAGASCSLLRRAHHLSNRGHCFLFALRASCSRLRCADVTDGVCVFFAICHRFFIFCLRLLSNSS